MSDDLPFDSHTMSATVAIDALKAAEFTEEQLHALRAHEAIDDGRTPRKTLLEAIAAKLLAGADEPEPEPEAAGEPAEVEDPEPSPAAEFIVDEEGEEPEEDASMWPGGLAPGSDVVITHGGQRHTGVVLDHRGGIDVRLRDGQDTVVFVATADAVKR